ncbi:hypothetical protein ONZ45_g8598 [Pleurotus djamor]|nr:hypothetical protein ONZ45_g8598 [Pleurotus djamor]
MVHRSTTSISADNLILTNLISQEKAYLNSLQSFLSVSHISVSLFEAYAAASPSHLAQLVLTVAQALRGCDDALRDYMRVVQIVMEEMKALSQEEEGVKNVLRDRDILVNRLIKASKSQSSSASGSSSSPTPTTKLAKAQSELAACEAHLSQKERLLQQKRVQIVQNAFAERCRAMVQCGSKWMEKGDEALTHINSSKRASILDTSTLFNSPTQFTRLTSHFSYLKTVAVPAAEQLNVFSAFTLQKTLVVIESFVRVLPPSHSASNVNLTNAPLVSSPLREDADSLQLPQLLSMPAANIGDGDPGAFDGNGSFGTFGQGGMAIDAPASDGLHIYSNAEYQDTPFGSSSHSHSNSLSQTTHETTTTTTTNADAINGGGFGRAGQSGSGGVGETMFLNIPPAHAISDLSQFPLPTSSPSLPATENVASTSSFVHPSLVAAQPYTPQNGTIGRAPGSGTKQGSGSGGSSRWLFGKRRRNTDSSSPPQAGDTHHANSSNRNFRAESLDVPAQSRGRPPSIASSTHSHERGHDHGRASSSSEDGLPDSTTLQVVENPRFAGHTPRLPTSPSKSSSRRVQRPTNEEKRERRTSMGSSFFGSLRGLFGHGHGGAHTWDTRTDRNIKDLHTSVREQDRDRQRTAASVFPPSSVIAPPPSTPAAGSRSGGGGSWGKASSNAGGKRRVMGRPRASSSEVVISSGWWGSSPHAATAGVDRSSADAGGDDNSSLMSGHGNGRGRRNGAGRNKLKKAPSHSRSIKQAAPVPTAAVPGASPSTLPSHPASTSTTPQTTPAKSSTTTANSTPNSVKAATRDQDHRKENVEIVEDRDRTITRRSQSQRVVGSTIPISKSANISEATLKPTSSSTPTITAKTSSSSPLLLVHGDSPDTKKKKRSSSVSASIERTSSVSAPNNSATFTVTSSPGEGKSTHSSHHRRTESLSVSPDGRIGRVKSVVVVGGSGSGVAGGAGESLMSIVEDVAKLNRSHTRSRSTSALNANYNANNGVDSASVQRQDSHGGLSEIVKAPPRVGRAELEREVSVSRGQVSPGARLKEEPEAGSFVIPRAPASIFGSTSSLPSFPATTSTPARHAPSGVNGHGHGRIPSTSTTASAASQSSRLVHQAHPVYPTHGSPRGSLDSGVSASTGLSGLSGGSSRMPLKSALKKSPAQAQAMASHGGYLGPGTGSRSSSPSPLRVGVLLGSEDNSGAAATERGEGKGSEKRIDEEDEVDTKSLPVVDGEEEGEGANDEDGDEVFLSADEGSSEGGEPTTRRDSSRVTRPTDKETDNASTRVARRKSLGTGTTKTDVPVVNGSSSTTNASRSTLVPSHPSSSPSSPMHHHGQELSDADAVGGAGPGSNSEPHRRKSVRVSLKPSYAAAPPPLPSPSPSSFEQERDGPHLHLPPTTPTPKASNSWGGRSNGEVVDMWKDSSSDEDGDEDEEYEKAKRLLSMSMSGGGGDKGKGKSRELNGR